MPSLLDEVATAGMRAIKTTHPVEPVEIGNLHRLISAINVRAMFGGVSDMTIWRWLNDAELDFPRPIYVKRRRFWREAELIGWIANRPRETNDSRMDA
jgi:predicted DNA-binding transcriptional regulator AlpA